MRNILLVIAGFFVVGLPKVLAEDAAPAATTPGTEGDAANKDGKILQNTKVHYKKGKRVDFSDQTIEGKLRRPEASIISANEGVSDNGLLRLREDFLDKFTAFSGEEIP